MKGCKNLNITGLVDVDWAIDPDDRRSATSCCVYIISNLVSWYLKKQYTISRSSTEVKYRSIDSATAEIIWIQSLMDELKVNTTTKSML